MLDIKYHKDYNSIFARYHQSSKKYVLIFNRWLYKKVKAKSITEYDTLEDAQEEINLINEMYKDIPRPIEKWFEKYTEEEYFVGDISYWGYILIDFENEKITVGNDGIHLPYDIDKTSLKKSNRLLLKDYFFRKDDEIPKEYEWNGIEEYEGWLRFRWGDGKNSIEYVDALKDNKKKSTKNSDKKEMIFEDTKDDIDEIVDKFDNELIRQMIERKEYKW